MKYFTKYVTILVLTKEDILWQESHHMVLIYRFID